MKQNQVENSAIPDYFSEGKAALIVAHPGHELRVYGWLEKIQPVVCVLTDGSGHTHKSRLDSTTRILDSVGATISDVYGRYTDAEIYQAVLTHHNEFFTNLAKDIAGVLVSQKIETVVGDASEGYNTGHDLCRLLINTAIEIARQQTGNSISNLEFQLTGNPATILPKSKEQLIQLRLDTARFERKLAAARNYPEMAGEVAQIIEAFGESSFQVEHFYKVLPSNVALFEAENVEPPFYELHGERQVIAGYYQHVIRYREHIAPVAKALNYSAAGKVLWSDYKY